MRWVIYATPYRHSSAGIRVLHRLCHLLNDLGEEAYVNTNITNDLWDTPCSGQITDDTIVVYPEVISGNPLNARRVVRYCLNKPGLLAGDNEYPDGELVFYYTHELLNSVRQATVRTITKDNMVKISIIEPELFYNDKLPKKYDCIYVGKGVMQELPATDQPVLITKDFPNSREATAKLLRQCKKLYSYDDFTALLAEAYLCGAETFIYKDGWIPHKPRVQLPGAGKHAVKRMIDIVSKEFDLVD